MPQLGAAVLPIQRTTAPSRGGTFLVVEYPGYLEQETTTARTSAPSLPRAVQQQLGLQSLPLETAAAAKAGINSHNNTSRGQWFRAPDASATTLALHLSGGPFAHAVQGRLVPTANLLLRIVRRTRQRRARGQPGHPKGDPEVSVTASIEGVIPRTGRFRAMADYQYAPPASDRMHRLGQAIQALDGDYIESEFKLQPDADPTPMPVLPPASMSSTHLPADYNYAHNPSSVLVQVGTTPQGTPVRKFLNRHRTRTEPTFIRHDPAQRHVPTAPPPAAVQQANALAIPAASVERMRTLFAQRPIWSRLAIHNQLPEEGEDRRQLKFLLPLVAYTMSVGPWRDCWVRYGVDPRADPEMRFLQLLDIRFLKVPPGFDVATRPTDGRVVGASVGGACAVPAGQGEPAPATVPMTRPTSRPETQSHQFDGLTLPIIPEGTATLPFTHLQLCDLLDPQLHAFLHAPRPLPPACDERHGWFPRKVLHCLREGVKRKVTAICRAMVAGEAFTGLNAKEEADLHRLMQQADQEEEEEGAEPADAESEGEGGPAPPEGEEGQGLPSKRPRIEQNVPDPVGTYETRIQAQLDTLMRSLGTPGEGPMPPELGAEGTEDLEDYAILSEGSEEDSEEDEGDVAGA